jgi:dipeptidyl aminopeptidase/acylaminoacyl peptidase
MSLRPIEWAVLSVLTAAPAVAQPAAGSRSPLDRAMDQLFATVRYREVRLAPDGRQVAWVQDAGGGTAIWLGSATPGGTPRRISASGRAGPRDEAGIAWSRDGRRIAFLSDAARAGQRQLYIVPAAGGTARKLTALRGFVSAPQWSPDGRTLAVLYAEGSVDLGGPFANKSAPTGVIGEEQEPKRRLALVDVATGRARALTAPDLCVHEYDWAPDGSRLALVAAAGSCDDNWYLAKVWSVDAASGETREIADPKTQLAAPRFSPDGSRVAFIGGLMSDEPLPGGDVYIVPASGGSARNVTPRMKAQASWIAWSPNGDRILMAQYLDGRSGIASVGADGGEVQTLWTGDESIAAENPGFALNLSLAADGKTTALVRESYSAPPEVWAGPIGHWTQLTRANAKLEPLWGEARSVHWKSDEFTVQGWLIFPRRFERDGRKYPIVVVVHGGPVWATSPAWPETYYNATLLSNEGYFVFYPNPRGSQGLGQDFTRAVVRDVGGGDLRDILVGIDEIQKTEPIDPERVGITGLSYGGYFSMWAPTQTRRFRASVSVGGLANWQSYYGQNGIDQWMTPFFGASVYDDPAVYRKSSPIEFIKETKTPTLIIVGEGDIETPVPQSYEYWHALVTLGVPTQLVIYPGEGHVFARPDHRRDVMRRMMGWFAKYLK